MATLLYFLPDLDRVPEPAALTAAGLGHLMTGNRHTLTARGCARGPNESAGVVLANADRLGGLELGYFPKLQTWRPLPAPEGETPTAWAGRYTDHPVTPDDLARPLAAQLASHPVELADGQSWAAPIALAWDIDEARVPPLEFLPSLPSRSTLTPAGDWVPGQILEQHTELLTIANLFYTAKLDAGSDPDTTRARLSFSDGHRAAVRALAANYHIGPAEADLCGLLTDRAAIAVLEALIDWPLVAEWLKKKQETLTIPAEPQAPAGSDSTPGPPDGCPGTDPVSASSTSSPKRDGEKG